MTRALHTVAAVLLAAVLVGPGALAYTPSRYTDDVWQTAVASADTSNSSGSTAVLADGLQCTGLQPSSTYLVQVEGWQVAATTTTGIQWRIGDGIADNDGSGSVSQFCRNAAAGTSEAAFAGYQSPGTMTYCLGNNSSTSGTPFHGSAIWTTDGSPSNVGVYFQSEVGGSLVTVKAGSMIRCRLLR